MKYLQNKTLYKMCKFIIFRLFQVTIRQDAQSVFTDDVVFENSLGPINFQTDNVYSGFLEGKIKLSVIPNVRARRNDKREVL